MRKKMIIALASAVALIAFLALFVDVIPPKSMTLTAMTETLVRISLYARQNNAIPQSLAVLPKRDGYTNRTTDGWKRPLNYEITSNGIVRLTSLGKDGLPGGTGDDTDVTRAYYALRPDGSLWATSEMWMVEARVTEERPQPER